MVIARDAVIIYLKGTALVPFFLYLSFNALRMKKTFFFISAIVILSVFVACGGEKDPKLIAEGPYETFVPATKTSPAYVRIDRQTINLNDFQKDEDGFITIFDGTFKGWRGYNREDVPDRWVIDNDAIKFSGSGGGEAQENDGGDLIFAYKFKNFEVSIDWKCSKGANSGIFYLAQEIKGEPIYISSPESQVLDNENHPDARMGKDGNRQSTSLYDMIPAKPQNANPFGEWNNTTIIVYRGTVLHQQNGENVLEYHLWTPQWTDLLQNSKFKPKGEFPLAFDLMNNLGGEKREGYIGLQDHGDDVWFKNIRIKILD